jgi:hypothetical protein
MTIKKGLKQNCLCDYTSPNQQSRLSIENVLPIRIWLAGIEISEREGKDTVRLCKKT